MFLWLSMALAGLSLCCVMAMAFSPWGRSFSSAPAGSFQKRCGVFWPWVNVLAAICRPFITWGVRRRVTHLAELAGSADDCKPEHIAALSVTTALVGLSLTVAGLWLAGLDDGWLALGLATGASLFFSWLPINRLKRKGRDRQLDMLRAFPFLLDMTTLCIEAGLNLQGALLQAAAHGPPDGLNHELSRSLSDMRAGMPRMEALKQFAARTRLPEISQWVMAIEQADVLGMSLGPILRAQSEQRRNERFLRAEKLALEAPVKMLFPMMICIFPCTFLVIGFPIAVKLLAADF